MQSKVGLRLSPKCFFISKNNHWLKRTAIVFWFIFFDYFLTLIFCQAPYWEANIYARAFMESFGIPFGLTLFVFIANLPIYITLTLDSHIIVLPPKLAMTIESFVDVLFAWFVAGLHFSGGTSWVWQTPDLTRQALGAFLYLLLAFLIIKPHKRR